MLQLIHACHLPQPGGCQRFLPHGVTAQAKVQEECSVAVMGGEEEDRVSVETLAPLKHADASPQNVL